MDNLYSRPTSLFGKLENFNVTVMNENEADNIFCEKT